MDKVYCGDCFHFCIPHVRLRRYNFIYSDNSRVENYCCTKEFKETEYEISHPTHHYTKNYVTVLNCDIKNKDNACTDFFPNIYYRIRNLFRRKK
jgi:hypothetical protein